MSNNLLLKELYINQVHIENNDIVIDELFQIVEASINTASNVVIKIFAPLNYANIYEIVSHNSNMGKYFYSKQGEIMRFMLDAEKCIHIDEKHDRLRRAIFNKR